MEPGVSQAQRRQRIPGSRNIVADVDTVAVGLWRVLQRVPSDRWCTAHRADMYMVLQHVH